MSSIDFTNPEIQLIVAGIFSLLTTLIAAWILSSFTRKRGFFTSLLGRARQETGLESYQQTLNEELLKISHPWMKENQSLQDILVSVNFVKAGSTSKEELGLYLRRAFKAQQTPRIMIVGKPGSGKSVAMRMIAKAVWSVKEDNQLVPVLLTFSDLKTLRNGEDLEAKIVEKLKYHQFEQGKRNKLDAQNFVDQHLESGKFVLLFDGYDELDKTTRETTAALLNAYLGTHRNISVVLSSRTGVYESDLPFQQLKLQRIDMAPFTPYAVLRFVSLWEFKENKSANELFELINGKAHLSELASNPLMLTIITFLYSMPKYTLPDNRVEFYEQCTRALLEEWDRTQNVLRANRFEFHQKVAILNRVAFEHISQTSKTDELIRDESIHNITIEEMKRMSLKTNDYPVMKNEIVLNSGLLQSIPPKEFRFPHRTFMEFFAANYIDMKKDHHEMLRLYQADPEKWQQTLLLYIGLNKKEESAKAVLTMLRDEFVNSLDGSKPKLMVFNALTECAIPDSMLADEILDLAEQFLTERDLSPAIIEELGFIAANPRWAYGQKAKDILLSLLRQEMSDEMFHKVLVALLRSKDEGTNDIVIKNLERIGWVGFFSSFGEDTKGFVYKVLAIELSEQDKQDIIEGLKDSGKLDILGSLLIENSDIEIKRLAAYALFRMSGLKGFFSYLDGIELGLLSSNLKAQLGNKFNEWGWSGDKLQTDAGKQMAILICDLAADRIKADRQVVENTDLAEVHNRFRYLTNGFLVEKGVVFHEFNLLGFEAVQRASKNGLKRHWEKRVDLEALWYQNSLVLLVGGAWGLSYDEFFSGSWLCLLSTRMDIE
ncbi:MAG: hypothetical protein ACI8WB_001664 [Phenylobacterium sp.]|jgi:hypothetical protein